MFTNLSKPAMDPTIAEDLDLHAAADDAGGFASPFGSQSIRQSLEVPRTRTSTHGGSDRDEGEALGFNGHFGGVSRSESFGNESNSGLDLNAENYNLRIQLETVADERDSYAADLVALVSVECNHLSHKLLNGTKLGINSIERDPTFFGTACFSKHTL